MTLYYPDVSSYQAGLRIQAGTVAVVAKATQGTTYKDPTFHDFMDQAAAAGAISAGYHFLEQGNAAAQAEYYHAFAGDIPAMIDCEPVNGSNPTVADCVDFIERLRELDGHVWGVYFPRWYWSQVGGDLSQFQRYGACLISSDYSGYTDNSTGAGWQPYGGATPLIWQTTSSQSYGGKLVDFNAFRGTLEQLRAQIQGDDMQLSDKVTFPPAAVAAFPDFGFQGPVEVQDLLTWTAARVSHIANHLPGPVDAIQLGALIASHLATGGESTPEAIAAAIIAAHPTLTVGSK